MLSELFQIGFVDPSASIKDESEFRREYTRVPYKAGAISLVDEMQFQLPILDISLRGLKGAISSTEDWTDNLVKNKPIDLVFPPPSQMERGNQEIIIHGKVAWRDGILIGIEFFDLDVESFTLLKNIILSKANDQERVISELVHLIPTKRRH